MLESVAWNGFTPTIAEEICRIYGETLSIKFILLANLQIYNSQIFSNEKALPSSSEFYDIFLNSYSAILDLPLVVHLVRSSVLVSL